jgi:Major Facilitator Superfamily
VLLLSAALFINYVDRGNLSTAAPLIQDELHLSATQLGFLLSAFYYSYVLAMAPVGWLAERFGAHRVLGAGVAIWAVSTFLQILRERVRARGTRQRARPRGLDVDSAAGRTAALGIGRSDTRGPLVLHGNVVLALNQAARIMLSRYMTQPDVAR